MKNLIEMFADDNEWVIPDVPETDISIYHVHNKIKIKIKEDITNTLIEKNNNYFTYSQISLALKHFQLLEYLYTDQSYKNRIIFLTTILDNGFFSSNNLITSEKSKWKLIKDKLSIFKNTKYSHSDNLLIEKSAIDFFRRQFPKFQFEVIDGYAYLNEKSENKFFHFIKKEVDYLNYMGLFFLLDHIHENVAFNKQSKRFIFDYNPPSYNIKNGIYGYIPYNYLLNLFLPFINNLPLFPKKEDKKKSRFIKLIEILRHYFNITNFFPTGYEDIFLDSKSIWISLRKNIHFDQIVSIPQIPTNILILLMKDIFLNKNITGNNDKFKISNLDSINKVYDFILERKITSGISGVDYFSLLRREDSRYKPLSSITTSKINKGYIHPIKDIPKKDLLIYPLLKESASDNLITLNSNIGAFTNIGWYEQVKKLSQLEDKHLGILVERFVAQKLTEKGINFKQSFTYNYTTPPFTEIQYIPKQGECDFIIETEHNILLIELKIKRLTIDSLAGNTQQIMLDYAKSYLLALNQALNHECILRENGLIENNLDKIILKNNEGKEKQIDKIALSLFEFDSLHDKTYSSSILSVLIGLEFSGNDASFDKEMNNILDKLRFKINYLKVKHNIEFNELVLGFNRLSLPQLLFILEHTSDTESFVKEINSLRHIAFSSTKDWYRGYLFHRDIINTNPDKASHSPHET